MSTLEEALRTRRSTRAFLQTPIEEVLLRKLFELAALAPSWCNIQPWRVVVTSGALTQRLTASLCEAARVSSAKPEFMFPQDYPEPYRSRRVQCAVDLYTVMGITRNDRTKRDAAWLRNFQAFGAPHVAIVSLHRNFDVYGALDIGCWLQSLMLAAESLGLATCAEASLASYPDAVRAVLPIDHEHRILVGVAIGYADTAADANRCRTSREPTASSVSFLSG